MRDKPKMKPAGKPMFAIAMDDGEKVLPLLYDGGEHDGAMIAFPSEVEAQRFIDDNGQSDTCFVVDLTDIGVH